MRSMSSSASAPQQPQTQQSGTAPVWRVQASWGALNTSNPIREIIETMNLAENPTKKVIPLSIGDPTIFGNLKPCAEILEALQRAHSSGKFYGYQTAAGMESAREAVADYHYRCTGNRVKRQDVILASGCSHAIDLCICVLARQGQNILIPRPGFPLYKTLTSVYGVQFKQYNLLADKNWSIDLKHLESLIDENTAAIVINNPSNPCGSVFSRKHLLQILELAERHKKPIIADEIYDRFVFAPESYSRHRRPALSETSPGAHYNCNGTLQQQQLLLQRARNRLIVNGKCNVENRQPVMSLSEEISAGYLLPADGAHQEAPTDTYNDYVDISEDGTVLDPDGCIERAVEQAHVGVEAATAGEEEGGLSELEDEPVSYVPFIALSSLSKTVPILTCGGISKTCLIPGLRLGWIIINDRQAVFDVSVRNGLSRLTQRLMGPNSLVQGALPDILSTVPETFYTRTMDFIFKNAKLCYERLRLVKGLQPHMPQGSMYLMVRFEAKSFPDIDGDLDFTSKLMNEESVLVLPGKCFDFPDYFRICLTVPSNVMEEALERMRDFCERHYVSARHTKLASLVKLAQNGYATQQEAPLLKLNRSAESSAINGHQANKCK